MTTNALIQLSVYCGLLLAMTRPLGRFMTKVYRNEPCGLDLVLGRCERAIYRIARVDPTAEMSWKQYAIAVMVFNFVGLVALYGLLRVQNIMPLNSIHTAGVEPALAFNTAVSFVTNTNWQSYGGESTMSNFSQMVGLTVQNFVSAATGMAVLVAFVRGFARHSCNTIGNFWFDMTRSTLYILLPLSVILATALVSQGVVQTLTQTTQTHVLQSKIAATATNSSLADGSTQSLMLGPVASQVAIKQLGTNGGGFYNVNSAHPFENPTPLSNLLQMLAILVIPAALCYTFGELVGDTRQGWAILAAMLLIFVPMTVATICAEQHGVPAYEKLSIDQIASDSQAGGNMEGKETRFGVTNSAIWATATTAASNGSVNAMHDSFTPLGGMIPMWLMQVGEVVFGGVGSGLYGMLVFAIIAVFIAGLMVGRTPEYLGKKIEAADIKMAAMVILIPPLLALIGTAWSVSGPGLQFVDATSNDLKSNLNNPNSHGFSEVLYAVSSASNNNGSAFAGLTANVPFYNVMLGVWMFVARFWLAIPVLALAGNLARKKQTPVSSGTLPSHTTLFVVLLVGAVVLVGALTFVPALALGPIVEHLQYLQ